MQDNHIISIKKQVHETVELNNDYTLPDYIVDVRKLVSCDARVVLQNVYGTANSFSFEGEVNYSILVICEDNSIKNLIYSEEFSLNGNGCGCEVSVHDCRLESNVARLVSPRKLNCRSKIVVTTKNNIEESTDTRYCGLGMPEAEFTTERKMAKCGYLMFFDEKVQNQHASRDIELTSTKDEIASIVYCRVNTYISERKVSDGKLFLRGETVAEILYENTNGNYIKHYDRVPFNDIIENSNGAGAHMCEILISDIKAAVRNNSFGEMKIIELDYTYSIRCRFYIEKESEVVADVYSTEYDVTCKCNSLAAMKLNSLFSSSLSVNDSCSTDELADGDILEIVDHNATVVSVNIKPDPAKSRVIISGDLKFDIVYKAEEYGYLTVTRPYKYEREFECTGEDVYYEHCVNAQPISCTIEKGRLLLNAELYFNVMIAAVSQYEYIQEAEFVGCNSENNSPVIIYYPNKDDTLWQIAKKYKTTCKDIISANSLNSDSLDGIKVLLLPKKKKKSIYNAII
ncbi:MAG: DUF3794 domain-containing protein [Clostridia bacterium]|nr:DUF3794 domain-containing protein [Clostridia bacterium]